MKKVFLILLVVMLVMAVCCTVALASDGVEPVEPVDWTQLLVVVVGLIFTGVITPLVKAGFDWLSSRTDNEALLTALKEAEAVADGVIAGLQAGLVDKLKEASAKGKLTKEEIYDIGITAFNDFKRDISAKSFAVLESNAKDITDYVARIIEKRLAVAKKA